MSDLCLDMVCQRYRYCSKGEKDSEEEFTKKHAVATGDMSKKIAPLTKASLEKVLPPDTTIIRKSIATISVSDDGRSVESDSPSSTPSKMPPPASIQTLTGSVISSDFKFVQETLRVRDEIETLNVAKAMLYEAYLKAIRGE
jgi:hypothetical protein